MLKQTGGWTYGLLFNHIWSYAGESSRAYVSSTFLQPFISYTTKSKTTFGLNTESTYDWNAEQWTAPINFSISQLTKIGKLLISFALGAKIYAEGPSGGPDWGLRFVVTPLFPTGGKSKSVAEPSGYSKWVRSATFARCRSCENTAVAAFPADFGTLAVPMKKRL